MMHRSIVRSSVESLVAFSNRRRRSCWVVHGFENAARFLPVPASFRGVTGLWTRRPLLSMLWLRVGFDVLGRKESRFVDWRRNPEGGHV